MTDQAAWTWDDPDPDWHASCARLEPTGIEAPLTRDHLHRLGLSGIQFGSWDGRHPGCLNTDVVGLTSGESVTEPGHVYRVDDAAYFVRLEATGPLPVADGAADWVYAEHVIEHLTLDEGIGWLREVHRVLAAGGLLRLTTPDLRRYVSGYLGDGGFFREHRQRLIRLGARPQDVPERPAFMLNQIFQFHGHRWIYDLDELRYALTTAGFGAYTIIERAFGEGTLPDVAALDRAVRNDETIYVEAIGSGR